MLLTLQHITLPVTPKFYSHPAYYYTWLRDTYGTHANVYLQFLLPACTHKKKECQSIKFNLNSINFHCTKSIYKLYTWLYIYKRLLETHITDHDYLASQTFQSCAFPVQWYEKPFIEQQWWFGPQMMRLVMLNGCSTKNYTTSAERARATYRHRSRAAFCPTGRTESHYFGSSVLTWPINWSYFLIPR